MNKIKQITLKISQINKKKFYLNTLINNKK